MIGRENRIGAGYGEDAWGPIRILKVNYPRAIVLAFFRLADVCLVSSLHDGMNLVAKEFVATRDDDRGVLVLSKFTGAAQELSDAIQVNPFDVEPVAAGLHAAIPTTQQTFEDVPPSNPFWLWIERLAGIGAINGYTCGGAGEPCVPPGNRPYFRWGANATRGQMSKIAAETFFPNCNPPAKR